MGCSNPQYRLASVVSSRRTNMPGLGFPEYCDGGRTDNSSMKNNPSSGCSINDLDEAGTVKYTLIFFFFDWVRFFSIADWASAQLMGVSEGLDIFYKTSLCRFHVRVDSSTGS